jgi:hypothetical protein
MFTFSHIISSSPSLITTAVPLGGYFMTFLDTSVHRHVMFTSSYAVSSSPHLVITQVPLGGYFMTFLDTSARWHIMLTSSHIISSSHIWLSRKCLWAATS